MNQTPLIEKHDNVLVVSISGKILNNNDDHPLIDVVEENLPVHKQFIFDLSALEAMNSSGINLFLKLFTKIRNTGGELIFCSIPPAINQLLIVTKLNSIFTISADLSSALAKLKSQDA